MPRPRTGSLRLRSSGYFARMWITRDGVTRRESIDLETTDRALARRKLVRLQQRIDAGELVADVKATAAESETVADFAEAWLARREAQGVVMVRDERANLRDHILPHLALPLDEVRPVHIRAVIDAAIAGGYRRGTVGHLHRLMGRLFKSAWQDEVIRENPVLRVEVPALRETKRERVILTDAEIDLYMGCPNADLELRMLSLVSRVEGGMRTGDLTRWDWTYIDLDGFAECTIPRAKTEKPQTLQIPEVLRPFLRAWWVRQDSPRVGPVFPVRRGKRKGGFKAARGTSFAKRLRRDLLRAGVTRREVHNDTPTTRKVDFHSFRRAFASALAGAEVSTAHAMKLTGHSDAKTHGLYVMNTPKMRAIPLAALPQVAALPVKPPKEKAPARANSRRNTTNHAAIEVPPALPANSQARAASGDSGYAPPFEAECRPFESDRARSGLTAAL